jgi:anti-sigma factor RsiW
MRATSRAMTTRQTPVHSHHGHSKAQCLKVLRRLSAFLDDELSVSFCQEIRKHLGACPNCEVFVTSLRQTISFCRCADVPSLSPAAKARLRREILKAIRSH